MERFLFHAEAYALTGRFTLPFEDVIPVQAMATLPLTGGFGTARVDDFDYRSLVSFRRATASVSGGQSKADRDGRGPYVSRSTIEIAGLSVMGMVTAEKIFASVSTSIPFAGGEASIYVQAGFENLRIAGEAVAATPNAAYFNRFPQWSQLTEETAKNTTNYRNDVRGFSLVKPSEISIPNFGKIYLAELFITPSSRRISMIRIELGCPEEGGIEIGGSGANGVGWP